MNELANKILKVIGTDKISLVEVVNELRKKDSNGRLERLLLQSDNVYEAADTTADMYGYFIASVS